MAKPTGLPPGREAWAVIVSLLFGERNHDRMHQVCETIGLGPPFMKALMALEPGEAKPMRVLADEWHCDASWVTTLVDTLEERGMVARRILPTDRRVKTIVLTDVGCKAKEKLLDLLHEPPPEMATLSDAEQRRLRDLLQKLAAAYGSES